MRVCTRCAEGTDIVPGRAICRACKSADDKASYAANREARRASQRAYYQANRESWNTNPERAKAYRATHRDRYIEHTRRRRAKARGVPVMVLTEQQIADKIAYWGGRCWMCGTDDVDGLDHVKPTTKGGAHFLCNLRPACRPCNARKFNTWPFPTATRWAGRLALFGAPQ